MGEKIKKIVFGVLGTVFFIFALCMAILLLNYNKYGVTQFEEYSLVLIKQKVSFDQFKKGDLVITEFSGVEFIKEGEVAFVYKLNNDNTPEITVGKVSKVLLEEDSIELENGAIYSSDFIAGTVYKIYDNGIGRFLTLIESKWGFLFLILVPCFLIFIFQLYALIVEVKYGKDDYGEDIDNTKKVQPSEIQTLNEKVEEKEEPKEEQKEENEVPENKVIVNDDGTKEVIEAESKIEVDNEPEEVEETKEEVKEEPKESEEELGKISVDETPEEEPKVEPEKEAEPEPEEEEKGSKKELELDNTMVIPEKKKEEE